MIATAIGSFALMLVAASASELGGQGARTTEFPEMFLGAWGQEGRGCEQFPGRAVITRHRMNHRQWTAGIQDATLLEHNRLRMDFRNRASRRRLAMDVTVGTTGSRLFITREGENVAILYRCEH